ncbi:tankyrase-1 [Lingula anatina]|uniref:Tankyrase-1 n=1 Tax=Lingula anatina TaxID=7574 RepID=A0A1S3JUI4_LINAN|nr:tankyrase-1 [Lingula anatina]XP_013413989.1 tankyrase-1 [Lingula anatina]|eukprot:XP_013413988.1 tankyrase-1 [Lingula anatina]
MALTGHIDIDVVDEDAYLRDLIQAVDYKNLKRVQFLMPSIKEQIKEVFTEDDGVGHYFQIATEDTSRYAWVLGEALRRASQQGTGDIVEFLLDSGADINSKNDEGFTALMKASERGQLDVVQILLRRGADVNLTNKVGSSALQWISRIPERWPVVKMLLEHKETDVNLAAHKLGKTALHCAAEMDTLGKTLRLLLDYNADQNAKAKDGRTALHFAAERGHHRNIVTLIHYGAHPHVRENQLGSTPMHLAAQNGEVRVVEELLLGGADPTIKDRFGRTAKDRVVNYSKIIKEKKLYFDELMRIFESQALMIHCLENQKFQQVIHDVCELIPDRHWIHLCTDLFQDQETAEKVNKQVKDKILDGGLPIIAYNVLKEWTKQCPLWATYWVFDRALRDNNLDYIADNMVEQFCYPVTQRNKKVLPKPWL